MTLLLPTRQCIEVNVFLQDLWPADIGSVGYVSAWHDVIQPRGGLFGPPSRGGFRGGSIASSLHPYLTGKQCVLCERGFPLGELHHTSQFTWTLLSSGGYELCL